MNIFNWILNRMRFWFKRPLDNDVNTVKTLIEAWRSSEMYIAQTVGAEYYIGNHDILSEEYDELEKYNRVSTLKKRIVDNQFKRVVDQKNNYSFGKPFTVQHVDQEYSEELNDIFTKRFKNTLRRITLDMFVAGVGFGYLYYDEQGNLNMERFKPWETVPVWKDEERDELQMVVHIVDMSYIERGRTVQKYVYEVYEPSGVTVYDESYRVLSSKEPYLYIDGDGYNWEKLPVVQFKLNDAMKPVIDNVKTLQDALNLLESTYYNDTTMNIRDMIFVLKGYPDEDLTTFYDKLMNLGVIAVDGEGDLETLDVKHDTEAYTTMLKELKKAIVENAMSYWRDLDKLGTNVNQMNILSMYSDIDLDADTVEAEVRNAFDSILWFVNTHLGRPESDTEDVSITFNRNMLMNESETIANIAASDSIVSKRTRLEHHPWVNNVQAELHLLDAEAEEARETLLENGLNPDGSATTMVSDGSDDGPVDEAGEGLKNSNKEKPLPVNGETEGANTHGTSKNKESKNGVV